MPSCKRVSESPPPPGADDKCVGKPGTVLNVLCKLSESALACVISSHLQYGRPRAYVERRLLRLLIVCKPRVLGLLNLKLAVMQKFVSHSATERSAAL